MRIIIKENKDLYNFTEGSYRTLSDFLEKYTT